MYLLIRFGCNYKTTRCYGKDDTEAQGQQMKPNDKFQHSKDQIPLLSTVNIYLKGKAATHKKINMSSMNWN